MNCPSCQARETRVLGVASSGHKARTRLRVCQRCGHRFHTVEVTVPAEACSYAATDLNPSPRHPGILPAALGGILEAAAASATAVSATSQPD